MQLRIWRGHTYLDTALLGVRELISAPDKSVCIQMISSNDEFVEFPHMEIHDLRRFNKESLTVLTWKTYYR